jgi:hypothetical protein
MRLPALAVEPHPHFRNGMLDAGARDMIIVGWLPVAGSSFAVRPAKGQEHRIPDFFCADSRLACNDVTILTTVRLGLGILGYILTYLQRRLS